MYKNNNENKADDKADYKVDDKADDNINVLSGDNKIDVGIKPDVKSNDLYLQLCSCSIVFNCFTRDSTAKNSD
jgi:hypothetical protein